MDRTQFKSLAENIFCQLKTNHVLLPGEQVDVPIFEQPIWGIAAADDPIFEEFKNPEAIGSNFKAPKEWMPGAKSVAAFFLPFTEEIRSRHREAGFDFDEAWRFGYGNHPQVLSELSDKLIEALQKEGVCALNPLKDPSFTRTVAAVNEGGAEDQHYDVSWSNRHSLYAAGLGTFGIHRHIISEKGCCGALLTLILDQPLEATPRTYDGVYDNCIHCGACIAKCPASAITMEYLRNLKICSAYAAEMKPIHESPCGKCLVGIPCEHQIPQNGN